MAKITRDVLESYLNCHYKAHLKLRDHIGIETEYERLLISSRQAVASNAIDKILGQSAACDVVHNISLTTSALREGPLFILNPHLDDDLISFRFDGLKRLAGPSELGDFHYVPMLFHEGRRVRKASLSLLGRE